MVVLFVRKPVQTRFKTFQNNFFFSTKTLKYLSIVDMVFISPTFIIQSGPLEINVCTCSSKVDRMTDRDRLDDQLNHLIKSIPDSVCGLGPSNQHPPPFSISVNNLTPRNAKNLILYSES